MPESPNIMVGTPAYNGMVHTDYVNSLLSFNIAGLRYSFLSLGGESLITRARNTILAHFHHNKSFTHLLFLDGDVFLDGEDVKKMLDTGHDVIGAPVPLKTLEGGRPVFNISGPLGEEGNLAIVERLGTAAMILSRSAVDALVEDAIEDGRVYVASPISHGFNDSEQMYDVFQVGVRNGDYLSEDYWICYRLRELGFNVYVDISIRTRHHGIRTFGTKN